MGVECCVVSIFYVNTWNSIRNDCPRKTKNMKKNFFSTRTVSSARLVWGNSKEFFVLRRIRIYTNFCTKVSFLCREIGWGIQGNLWASGELQEECHKGTAEDVCGAHKWRLFDGCGRREVEIQKAWRLLSWWGCCNLALTALLGVGVGTYKVLM